MKKSHYRKCIGCGTVKDRDDMIKLTSDFRTGDILVNPDSKIFGRSAYICNSESCVKSAFKKNKISKFLKKIVSDDIQKKIFSVLDDNIMIKH